MYRNLNRVLLLALAGVLLLAGLLLAPGRAVADDPWGSVDCQQDPTQPQCVVEVTTGDEGTSPGTSGTTSCTDFTHTPAPCFIPDKGWNGGDGCYYKPAKDSWADAFGHPPPPAAWYEGWCGDVARNVTILTRMVIFDQPPGQTLLIDEALRRLQLPAPVIHLNPPPPAVQLVQVPMWMWLDTPVWTVRSATASVPGLSVTATARPTSVVWSTGDGATVTCHGPGTPWTPGTDPTAASPDCGHTYTTSSGRGTFTLRATISWTVTWAGGGLAGTEPALTSTSFVTVRVNEASTLNNQ